MKTNKDIIILNADKSNKTVIMKKTDNNTKIENLLSNDSTYIKLEKDPTNDINLQLKSILLTWKSKKIITDNLFKHLHSNTNNAPKFYGLPKFHKPNCPLITMILIKLYFYVLIQPTVTTIIIFIKKLMAYQWEPHYQKTLANIVMEEAEAKIINKLTYYIKFYYRYIDDTLICLTNSKINDILHKFNKIHPKLIFTLAKSINDSINFLDLNIIVENNKIIIYNKFLLSNKYCKNKMNETIETKEF